MMTNVLQTRGEKTLLPPLPKLLGVVIVPLLLNMPNGVRAQDAQVQIAIEDIQISRVVIAANDEKKVREEKAADNNQKENQEAEEKSDGKADAERLKDAPADEKEKDDEKPKPKKPPKYLRAVVNGELSFIKRVANPTPEQMDQIVKEAKSMLQDVTDDIVQARNKAVRWNKGDMFIYGPRGGRLKENPFKRVPDEFAAILKPILDENQFQQYQTEVKLRKQYERDASIRSALQAADHRVVLTKTQHEKLYKLLMKEWKQFDLAAITVFSRRNNMAPPIPDEFIDQVLNERQKAVWKDTRTGTMYLRLSDSVLSQLDEEWIK